jgi:hypothetical protein
VIAFAFATGIVELGNDTFGQSQSLVCLAKQKNAGVGCDLFATEIGYRFASFTPCELNGFCGTNCHGKTSCEIISNQLNYIIITDVSPLFL